MSKIRVVIVDDMKKIVDYFKMIIDNEHDMEVVGCAETGKEAVKVVREKQPDVLLTDINMETKYAGIEAARIIKNEFPEVKIIVLTIHKEDDMLFKAYSVGAMDYILKTSSVVDILMSVRKAVKNEISLSPENAEKIVLEYSRINNQNKSMLYMLNIITKLTDSELEIIKNIYEGKPYKEIAKERSVEVVTIKGQVNTMLKKFKMKRMKEVIKMLEELQFFESFYLD